MKWQPVFDRLNRLSKERALTEPESNMLERSIFHLDREPERSGRRTEWQPEEDARLCDLIAGGMSLTNAGKAMGKTKGAVIGRWKRIREQMGWQAT